MASGLTRRGKSEGPGMQKSEGRNPKAEIRRPKEVRNPNSEATVDDGRQSRTGYITNGVRLKLSGSRSDTKAAEGSRTPRRFAHSVSRACLRQVVECGCPLPLSLEPRATPDSLNRTLPNVEH